MFFEFSLICILVDVKKTWYKTYIYIYNTSHAKKKYQPEKNKHMMHGN